jgi:hypothetical protein
MWTLIKIETSVPVTLKGKYQLNFERKAKIVSAKNFILLLKDILTITRNREILFCKGKEEEFSGYLIIMEILMQMIHYNR